MRTKDEDNDAEGFLLYGADGKRIGEKPYTAENLDKLFGSTHFVDSQQNENPSKAPIHEPKQPDTQSNSLNPPIPESIDQRAVGILAGTDNPVYGLSSNGHPVLGFDEGGLPLIGLNSAGSPVYDTTKEGWHVLDYDASGKELLGYTDQKTPIYALSQAGYVCTEVDPQGRPVFAYDAKGQPVSTDEMKYIEQLVATAAPIAKDSFGNLVYGYDKDGYPILSVSKEGKPVIGFDHLNNPVLAADDLLGFIYFFDQQGKPVFGYDGEGNPIYKESLTGGSTSGSRYYPKGRKIDGKNQGMLYDSLGRLLKREKFERYVPKTGARQYIVGDKQGNKVKNPDELQDFKQQTIRSEQVVDQNGRPVADEKLQDRQQEMRKKLADRQRDVVTASNIQENASAVPEETAKGKDTHIEAKELPSKDSEGKVQEQKEETPAPVQAKADKVEETDLVPNTAVKLTDNAGQPSTGLKEHQTEVTRPASSEQVKPIEPEAPALAPQDAQADLSSHSSHAPFLLDGFYLLPSGLVVDAASQPFGFVSNNIFYDADTKPLACLPTPTKLQDNQGNSILPDGSIIASTGIKLGQFKLPQPKEKVLPMLSSLPLIADPAGHKIIGFDKTNKLIIGSNAAGDPIYAKQGRDSHGKIISAITIEGDAIPDRDLQEMVELSRRNYLLEKTQSHLQQIKSNPELKDLSPSNFVQEQDLLTSKSDRVGSSHKIPAVPVLEQKEEDEESEEVSEHKANKIKASDEESEDEHKRTKSDIGSLRPLLPADAAEATKPKSGGLEPPKQEAAESSSEEQRIDKAEDPPQQPEEDEAKSESLKAASEEEEEEEEEEDEEALAMIRRLREMKEDRARTPSPEAKKLEEAALSSLENTQATVMQSIEQLEQQKALYQTTVGSIQSSTMLSQQPIGRVSRSPWRSEPRCRFESSLLERST